MPDEPNLSFIEKEINHMLEQGIPDKLCREVKNKITGKGLTLKQIRYFCNQVYMAYQKALVSPGETVGTVAAQSIGEPGTQMSLPGTEKVIVRRGENVDLTPIGDIIDNILAPAYPDLQKYPIENSLVLNLPPDSDLMVLALGQDEKVQWKRVRQVSRHPPNGDLLQIQTRSGRKITATFAHSFVIRQENKVVSVAGRDLILGDRIPLVKNIPCQQPQAFLPLQMYLPPNEVWYGTELRKAAESKSRLGRAWKEEFNVTYTVPVMVDDLRNVMQSELVSMMQADFIYPFNFHNVDIKMPEQLPLDYHTGWFIGAYLAEGSLSSQFVTITNVDPTYQQNAIDFAMRLNISHSVKMEEGEFGPSASVFLHSALLAKLFARMCGKTSGEKHVPGWALNTPDEFVRGLLRGYFDGDGSFSVERQQIRVTSKSKQLLKGISLLLARKGIATQLYKERGYSTLRISGKYTPLFNDTIGSDLPHKRAALQQLTELEQSKSVDDTSYDVVDMIPGFGTILNQARQQLGIDSKSALAASIRNATRKQNIGRQTLSRYLNHFISLAQEQNKSIEDLLAPLEQAVNGDIIWDEIIGLKLVPSSTPCVYDFAVEDSETFMTGDGLITHNTLRTFHFAGVAEMSVTQGLPRLIEIVDARRNPSTPVMRVFLKGDYAQDRDKALEVHREIEEVRIESIAYTVEADMVTSSIVIELIPELVQEKGIEIDKIPEKFKRVKKENIQIDGYTIILEIGGDEGDIQKLQKVREKIQRTIIKGIKGVKRGIISKEPVEREDKNGNITKQDEYVIQTEGTNLEEVMLVPGVDAAKTFSNHIHEIEELFGIEAARSVLIKEAFSVLDDQGLDVDYRHLLVMSDLMTTTGIIRQIGRHGISGEKQSVLARAAFEVTIKQLLEASLMGEEEPLKGIPENVIVGQIIPVGTGSVDLMMDLDRAQIKKKD